MSTSTDTQNFANHARWVPGFHFVTGPLTITVLAWTLYRLATVQTSAEVLPVLMALALMAQFWYIRAFPMAVQDRVIRLEERLRLAAILPPELHGMSQELTPNQLIALRFASDAELPGLTKRVFDEKLTDRAAIKGLVAHWRADHMRA